MVDLLIEAGAERRTVKDNGAPETQERVSETRLVAVRPPKHVWAFYGWPGVALAGMTTYLRERPVLRHLVIWAGLAALVGLGIATASQYFVLWMFGAFPVFIVALGGLLAGPDFDVRYAGDAPRDSPNSAKAAVPKNPMSPQEQIEEDAKRVGQYYAINQAQVRSSFRVALVAMVVGFVLVAAGVVLVYVRPETRSVSALSIVAGLVSELISGLFLRLNADTQKGSLRYFDTLVEAQRLSRAVQLAESHEDVRERAVAKNAVIRHLVSGAALRDTRHDELSASK